MHYAIADFVLDLVQNSVEAGAQSIEVDIDEAPDGLRVRIADDGCGMDEHEKARALDPFRSGGAKHPGRKVGLGLPFVQQAVTLAGGWFSLKSEKGKGTEVQFFFPGKSVDSPPLGDPVALFTALLSMAEKSELKIRRTRARDGLSYEVKKSELAEAVGELASASSLSLVRQFLASQEEG
ncbi:Histidine kinase [uncultured spirochete]|jgi:hypothetical protein|uniref:histidine kinase n=1 Tax=uncultured spirochete TaxID=156406 RepID=A0A3P3XIF0_9SPIR|nr:ATP-binding protein [Rectinema subterraneum]SLM12706.1 Histidine kinase [uncultured spirochete]HCX96541.1 ATP-binding protein [Spirochaetaceae bacterium]